MHRRTRLEQRFKLTKFPEKNDLQNLSETNQIAKIAKVIDNLSTRNQNFVVYDIAMVTTPVYLLIIPV